MDNIKICNFCFDLKNAKNAIISNSINVPDIMFYLFNLIFFKVSKLQNDYLGNLGEWSKTCKMYCLTPKKKFLAPKT